MAVGGAAPSPVQVLCTRLALDALLEQMMPHVVGARDGRSKLAPNEMIQHATAPMHATAPAASATTTIELNQARASLVSFAALFELLTNGREAALAIHERVLLALQASTPAARHARTPAGPPPTSAGGARLAGSDSSSKTSCGCYAFSPAARPCTSARSPRFERQLPAQPSQTSPPIHVSSASWATSTALRLAIHNGGRSCPCLGAALQSDCSRLERRPTSRLRARATPSARRSACAVQVELRPPAPRHHSDSSVALQAASTCSRAARDSAQAEHVRQLRRAVDGVSAPRVEPRPTRGRVRVLLRADRQCATVKQLWCVVAAARRVAASAWLADSVQIMSQKEIRLRHETPEELHPLEPRPTSGGAARPRTPWLLLLLLAGGSGAAASAGYERPHRRASRAARQEAKEEEKEEVEEEEMETRRIAAAKAAARRHHRCRRRRARRTSKMAHSIEISDLHTALCGIAELQ